ncbi:MAG: YqaJ viral recombinase family protein [Sphaerochaeta sp.]|nr:YqaJ viral recombinase family protein [Sphaerochaeta sp.]
MIQKISYKDRAAWLDCRRKYIGGSDAAAVLGLSKWSSPLSVYADKLGLVPEREDNEAMRQGRDLEDYVAQRFSEKTGLKVRRENHIIVNDEVPFMAANIDRRIVGVDEGLECKTTSVYNKTDFEGGDVPKEYYVQCVHYLAVTRYRRWHLAVLVLNKGFYTFTIDRNDIEIDALIALEKKFYDEHIVVQIPPEPEEGDSELLSTLYPHSNDGFVPLQHISATLKELASCKAQAKMLDGTIKTLENFVKQALGDASQGSDGTYKVSWTERSTTRLDSKALQKAMPDIYAQFSTTNSYRTFLIKEDN